MKQSMEDSEAFAFLMVPVSVTHGNVRELLRVLFKHPLDWWSTEGYRFYGENEQCDFEAGGKHNRRGAYAPFELIPLEPGCAIIVTINDEVSYTVHFGPGAVMRGLQLLVSYENGSHWMKFLTGKSDRFTADTFFQLALFGEVLFR